jgi:phage-related protein
VKVSVGFTTGLQTGLALAPGVAKNAVTVVNIALLSGIATAFSAGANISRGFANGMLSQLGVIQSAAAKMAAAADKAVRAKAKIHSPSKVAEGLGSYWGEGYVGGILNSVKDAWNAAEQLVSVPQVATPKLAAAYGGELGGDYNYSNSSEYVIEVPVVMDGKEVARVTAPYTQAELNRIETRDSRKRGRV